MISLSHLFQLPGLTLDQVELSPHLLTISLVNEASEASCPLCEHSSHRIHSRYQRTLQDVPSSGRVLRLLLDVRRFFCTNAHCPRKIFAERFPNLTTVYARRTTRCTQALTELGFCSRWKSRSSLGKAPGLAKHSYDAPANSPSNALFL